MFVSTETDQVVDGKTIHNLTIYDGAWWGFQTAALPEPGQWAQGLCGSVVVILVGLWRRVAARRAVA